MSTSPNDRDRVTDEIAQQLFARAAAVDEDGVRLAQLRSAAIEAGISEAAFDQAVREWRSGSPTTDAALSPSHRVLRNVGAFAAGWTSLAILAAADRLLSAPGLVHKLTDPIGLVVGTMVAMRVRARTAAVVMGGLAVSQTAEFLMDLFAGAPAIHGFYAHIGLMIAGVGGVAISQLRRSRRGPGRSSSIGAADPASDRPKATPDDPGSRGGGLTNAEADKRFIELLRLRRTSYLTRFQLG